MHFFYLREFVIFVKLFTPVGLEIALAISVIVSSIVDFFLSMVV